jgi:hypothetical protein
VLHHRCRLSPIVAKDVAVDSRSENLAPSAGIALILKIISSASHTAAFLEVVKMQRNVGTLDKAGRAALSMLLFAFAWKRKDRYGVLAAYNAGMLMSSVASGYCPLYKIAKIKTVGKPV